jgi:hypothetical protein
MYSSAPGLSKGPIIAAMDQPGVCDICGRQIPAHGHYIVRIEVFADPAMPAVSEAEMEQADYAQVIADLLKEMEQYSVEDLQDQVHRQFEFRICRVCQIRFLVNPLGKPRGTPPERLASN